ncbi:FadR/GntR family transcriptional regulator [Pseudonocardia zijingensis]|jgi:DNA-binding FadR family transcriptional regulator|uniref:FadR/GntR family transcriptional regulator n=1 Tax=Pseudonocardia zijingensis TaxID=153376 RepID=A0ABN1N907_9PSEU
MAETHVLVAEIVPFLLSRGYGPNERAPSERELAERFGASRTQVREALSVLEALRLIERRPKSGIYMTTESASIEALRLYAEIGVPLSGDIVGEIVEVRRIQEIEAIRLACRRHRQENVDALRACLDEWTYVLEEPGRLAELDRRFHTGIVRAAQNSVLLRLVDLFYRMTERRRLFYFGDPERARQSLREHEEILTALTERDEERAVRLLDKHLSSAGRYWDYLLNGSPPAQTHPA